MRNKLKKIIVLLLTAVALVFVAGISATFIYADEYYTITVEYKYDDGETAYDPYKAVYAKDVDIDVQITNPIIPGYRAVADKDDPNAETMLKTDIVYNDIDRDVTYTVYYVPAVVNYRVRYFFQNIENDLYTERLDLDTSLTDKTGVTGTYPAELETIEFDGFTTLFHEPDVIAADGSTVFQIYYDRDYVLMNFNLEGGYGVEPIYAKYSTHFNIPEPQKSGYSFRGWRDEKGNISKFTSGEVPAEDVTYTAVWDAVNTNFTIIYWTENANDNGYSYSSSVTKQALSGTTVKSTDYVEDWDYADKDYFLHDATQFDSAIVEGDGSTVLNVYFKRRVYTLKFYYARYITNDIVMSPVNVTSIPSGSELYLHCKKGGRYLTDERYNNQNRLAFGDYETLDRFTFESVDSVTDGYYIRNASGQYLTIAAGTSGFTDTPTVVNVKLQTDGYWTVSVNGQYLNNYQATNTSLAGWTGIDDGSRWYLGTTHKPSLNSQVCARTNEFQTNTVEGDEIPTVIFGTTSNDPRWVNVNTNDLPVLSERYQRTKGEEIVGEYTYCYFTIDGKYEESLEGRWPINEMQPIMANGRMNFFGAWNPTKDSYYYSVKDELFNTNNTIKGEYQKLDKFILIKNKPDRKIVPFLAFWTNSLDLTWNWSRQWLYHIYVPILEGETVDQTYVLDGVTYKKYAVYNTFDTNESIGEQTPTALDGFTHFKSTRTQNANNYILEHEGGTTSMPSFNANFYYTRNSYNLTFKNNGTTAKEVLIPYETALSGEYFVPEYPDPNQKSFYKFGGWYTTEECFDGTEFDFSASAKMPANHLIVFAKWEKVKHNVTFYNDYNDYTGKVNALKTVQTLHNELIFTNDVPTTMTPPTSDAQFAGWYYYDNRNNKVRFDPQSIPVTRAFSLFAEWSSKQTANYQVRYVEQGTDTPVADDSTGAAFIGKTKTFQAKGYSDLNASHAWNDAGTNWWPLVSSHSISIDTNTVGAEPNTYVFEYIKKASVGYTVRYVNTQTGEEVHASKTVDSHYSIVSEHFVYVKEMIADAVSKTLVLAAYDTVEEEYQNNVITFYYTPNTTEALYQVNHHIQNADGNGYSLYTTQTEIVSLNFEVNPESSVISIPGFAFVPGLTQVNGTITTGSDIADGNILVIDLYYNRLTFGYIVYYREYGNDTNILQTIAENPHEIVGTKVSHTAPESITLSNGELYNIIGTTQRTLEIRADAGNPPTMNVINVYYQKKSFYTIRYEAVCIPETTEQFGQVSLAYEIVDQNSLPQGSSAMLLDAVRYEFKGWYRDAQGNDRITPNVQLTTQLISSANQDTTFYAVFGIKTADLTITQSGGLASDSFLYRIVDVTDPSKELIVSVNGGESVTIKDLPCGKYTVTEITAWDWRYKPDTSGSTKEITIATDTAEQNKVSFTNQHNDKNWLGGESNKDNIFE